MKMDKRWAMKVIQTTLISRFDINQIDTLPDQQTIDISTSTCCIQYDDFPNGDKFIQVNIGEDYYTFSLDNRDEWREVTNLLMPIIIAFNKGVEHNKC